MAIPAQRRVRTFESLINNDNGISGGFMEQQRESASISKERGLGRREIMRGAAWTVPIIATASAAPIAAASGCEVTQSFTVAIAPPSTANLTANYAAVTQTFVVPAGVTSLEYEVAGGGGGVNRNFTDNVPSGDGGDGDLVRGVLAVVPGTTLTIVVGNGGIGPSAVGGSSTPENSVIKGGSGFGDGGDMPTSAAQYRYAGGSGGGGSAILVGGQPVVVAGGGGGSGGGSINGASWVEDAEGGAGGTTAAGGGRTRATGNAVTYEALGGPGANGATPGTRAGGGTMVGSGGTVIANKWELWAGHSGTLSVGGVGGRGGDGVLGMPAQNSATDGGNRRYTSGGGGGGYAGGAGGDSYARSYTTGAASDFSMSIGGGGGGGSSFTSSAAGATQIGTPTHAPAGNGSAPSLTRNPGWATLTYRQCQ